MRLYLDTADLDAVGRLMRWGAFAGVTTNPIILARANLEPARAVAELCQAQPGDVFVQVDGDDPNEMERQVRELNGIETPRVMIKIPPTPVGLEVMHRLRDERIWTVATALHTLGQALLAANAGADILAPFFGRMLWAGLDAAREITDMIELCARRGGRPRVLVASLKSVDDVLAVARLGAWGAAVPVGVAEALIHHPGTDDVLARFAEAGAGPTEE